MPQRYGVNRRGGGGPFLFETEEPLDPGEVFGPFNFRKFETGRFVPWIPFDSATVKNLDTGNRVRATFNGKFRADIEPNAVDTFGDAGIVKARFENQGTGTIDAGDLVVTFSVESYDADQEALDRERRHPVENMVRGVFNL